MKEKMILPMVVIVAIGLIIGVVNAAYGHTVTVNLPSAGNATWITQDYQNFSITLNASAANVTLANNTAGSAVMSGSGLYWWLNVTGLTESSYVAASHNNFTISIEQGGSNETNYTYYFYVDSFNPVVTNNTDTVAITNTTGGDQVLISSTIVDNSTDTCVFYLFQRDTASDSYTFNTSLTGVLSSATTRTPNCNLTIERNNFSRNGYWALQSWVNDSAGRVGWSDTNITLIVNILRAEEWTAIGALLDDNVSRGTDLMTWVANHSHIDYIATFNETAQGFLTHQRGTNTNNITGINYGEGMYIYTSAQSILIRELNTTDLGIQWENHSVENLSLSGPWNLIGNVYSDFNLSELSSGFGWSNWVSYHNISNGYYYTYKRAFGPNAHDKVVIVGSAFWMDNNRTTETLYNKRTNSDA
jgi:hypothetical protein